MSAPASTWRTAFYVLALVVAVAALTVEIWIVTAPKCDAEPVPTSVRRFGQVVGRQDCEVRDEACARGLDHDNRN